MKIKNYLLAGLLTVGVGFTSCSEDEVPGIEEGQPTALTVKIAGSSMVSRATSPITNDSDINDFWVYVFNHRTGELEADKKGNPAGKTTIESVSTAGTKRIVVLTNLGTDYPVVENYNELAAAKMVNLDEQKPELLETNGFVMSGEVANHQLNTTEENLITVPVKRVVAMITLNSLTIIPANDDLDITKLEILGVAAQRVAADVTLAPVTSNFTDEDGKHYGGFDTNNSQMTAKEYLKDVLDLEKDENGNLKADHKYTPGNTFYVFPNGDKDNCTLLTIQARYNDGDIIYYPIKINYRETLEENTDGYFVENNKKYVLNLTLKDFADGTTDPEIPKEDVDIEVEVKVEEWEVITQNEEW